MTPYTLRRREKKLLYKQKLKLNEDSQDLTPGIQHRSMGQKSMHKSPNFLMINDSHISTERLACKDKGYMVKPTTKFKEFNLTRKGFTLRQRMMHEFVNQHY